MTSTDGPEWVRPQAVHNDTITLADPDPCWATRYAAEQARIRAALGDRVVRLEHVGSTSVPGLAAKPIIDILLEVASSADEPGYVPDLERAGYDLHVREPAWHEHRVLRSRGLDVNLHVFTAGCPETERMLLFRDRLRDVPQERERYERTKRELAVRRWERIQDYADAKSAVVEGIIARARQDGHAPLTAEPPTG